MSLNDRETRRSNRLAGIPPPALQPYVVQHTTTPIPPMPDTIPPAPAVSTHPPTSQYSSDLLSESIHTYGNNTVPMQQTHRIPPPNIQLSSSSSNNPNDTQFHPNDHNEYTPTRVNPQVQHIRGQNTIPNFISSYHVNQPSTPTQHHIPTQFQYPAPTAPYNNHPMMNNNNHNHNQMVQQFNAMQQQMQLNHQQQLRDLEYRFDQKLQQNTVALSQSLATTLGDTIKHHLQQHDGITTTSGSSSTVNLLDMESVNNITKPPQKSVQFHSNPIRTSSPYHHIQEQHIPQQESARSTESSTQELAKLLLAAKEPKLYFPSYKPTADYDNWKMLCILKASKHTTNKILVVVSDSGNRFFNPSMTSEQSSTLFMLTMEALGTHADKLSIDMNRADGLALWKLLDRVNLNIDTNVTNQETLSHQFNALKREKNEDYEAFALRFTRKLKELKYNEVEVTNDPQRIAFKLLRGLNEQVINTRICMELSSKPEWFINITIPEIAAKAKKYMKSYQSLSIAMPYGKPNPVQTPQLPSKPSPAPAPKPSAPVLKPKPSPAPSPSANDTPTKPKREVDDDKVNTMMTALRNTSDKYKYLNDLKVQDSTKFNSMETRHACTRIQCYPLWNTVARGLPPTDSPAPAVPNVPTPAARRVQFNEEAMGYNIQEQVQQALQTALGDHGSKLLQELQSLDMNNQSMDPDATINENSNNTKTSTDPYLSKLSSLPVCTNSSATSKLPTKALTQALITILQKRLNLRRVELGSDKTKLPLLPPIQSPKSTMPPAPSPTLPTTTTPSNVIASCKFISTTDSNDVTNSSTLNAVIDSGATDNMTAQKSLFEDITYYNATNERQPYVMLGDEHTYHPVEGYGWINYKVKSHHIRQMALYIPALGETTLLSVKQHMSWLGNYFHAEKNIATLAFPTFHINLSTDDEISMQIIPFNTPIGIPDFNEATASPVNHTGTTRQQSLSLISCKTVKYIPDRSDQDPFKETVQVTKLTPTALLPTQETKGAAGFDVCSTQHATILPGEIAKLGTGLSTALPDGMYIRIAPRSSLAVQHITVEGGVVDSDYRGEIKVLLKNNSTTPFIVHEHDRIAQFIFERAATPYLQLLPSLPSTVRNTGGFGSTNTTKPKRCRRHQTFRLDSKYVLYTNFSNPFRPVSRRAPCPLVQPSPILPAENVTNPLAEEEQATDSYNPITTHTINSKTNSPVDPVLQVAFDPIPISMNDKPLNTSPVTTPQITPLPVDSVNNALPKRVTMSRDALHRAIGFQNTTSLIKHMHQLGTKSVNIQNLPRADNLDPGETASIHSARRNTNPLQIPQKYGDIWHMDIGYGPDTAIGGIKYTLLLVDKFSRYKFIYGLKNLTTSLHEAMRRFLLDCSVKPTLIRTDFDQKLMGGEVAKILLDNKVKVESSPPYRQHQNGLVERQWQTLVNMARNWLKSSMLPMEYWYFAIKRACEVSNLLPITRNEKTTTPYELVYNRKVDYRSLFPMFSLAYIRQHREDGQDKNKWTSKSLKCILVGKCNKSDSLLFYHPPSKQTLSCADGYRFDMVSPAGPQFGKHYDGDFIFTTKSALSAIHKPPSHEENATVYINIDNNYKAATVLNIPINDDNEPYTVQEIGSGDIHQILAEEMLDHDPSVTPTDIPSGNHPFPHLQWIEPNAKVTMYLPNIMKKSKQGRLQQDQTTKEWTFHPGRVAGTNEPIDLPNFHLLVDSMINNKKLFKGWINSARAHTARRTRATSNTLAHLIINRKVSAKNLHLLQAPTLLKHHKLHPDDKKTWDSAYKHEYDGLMDIDTWEVITEDEYNNMRHILGNLLPTMAISVIKHDGDGNPVRAKYRIVALGNLDPHDWSKNDCFAPVLSQMELRFLTALAVKNKCIPKTGDVTQAFCQSYLPEGEEYVCRPPPGCPITPPNTYWKLKKTLYGLKRSPRHFYELAKKTLLSIGLKQHPFSPCIFYGTLIDGEPPLYLGLYVDDFYYFSASKDVEQKFEKDFGGKMDMEFNGPVTYFLGIKFITNTDDNGDVSIQLTQEAFIESLVASAGLDGDGVNEPKTPYRVGYPVDKIPQETYDEDTQHKYTHLFRVLVGSLNWLSISTRPDIATITNMLAKYSSQASKGHIEQAKRVIKYLKGTKSKGILFSSKNRDKLESFVKFPIPTEQLTSLTDANWGPQDQSKPTPENIEEIELFKSRSISGYLIWLGGPVHWMSKRQSITARSSAEAEIYATDECTKQLITLSYLIDGLDLSNEFMSTPTPIFNDNSACVCWSKATTTKGLRHIQMRENAVRESVLSDFITVQHIEGKLNLADMFTKEDKDTAHFIQIRDFIMTDSVDSEL